MLSHAKQRATTRLLYDVGMLPEEIDALIERAEQYAVTSSAPSEAIMLHRLKKQVNQAWGAKSNGNEVWAIIRDNHLVTIMLRRSTQPKDPKAFSVQNVVVCEPGWLERAVITRELG